MVSTTQTFWAARSRWTDDEPDVIEVECFVAVDNKVVAVPGAGFTGYTMTVGQDVFVTKDAALAEAFKRATKDREDFKRYLAQAGVRIARLLKEGAT